MSGLRWIAVATLFGVAAVAIGAARPDDGPGPIRTIEIDVRFSRFGPDAVRVPVGIPVRIILANGDPIDHEWIVADAAGHQRHRTGTEPSHGARPTERSIPAGTTVETVVTFAAPGTMAFICHLPGHEAYGMVGSIVVGDG